MTEAKLHTRGPWVTQGWVPTWAYIPVKDADHNLVASLYPAYKHGYTPDHVEANAHLIAAAPDMLAALRIAEDSLAAMFSVIKSVSGSGGDCPPALRFVRGAIAKAEGRPMPSPDHAK